MLLGECSVGIPARYCFCPSLAPRMIHFSDLFPYMNCRGKILQLFKKRKREPSTLFRLNVLQSSALCCYFGLFFGFFLLHMILDSIAFFKKIFFWNIPEQEKTVPTLFRNVKVLFNSLNIYVLCEWNIISSVYHWHIFPILPGFNTSNVRINCWQAEGSRASKLCQPYCLFILNPHIGKCFMGIPNFSHLNAKKKCKTWNKVSNNALCSGNF